MVHIYTIGYMHDDDGYQRFFSYISLFTFSMLMLVMSNNFMQLFFGWEAVGVVSYLLIGFWYTRPDRDFRQPQGVYGQSGRRFRLRARHRRGAALHRIAGLCDGVRARGQIAAAQIHISSTIAWPAITFTCICLFIGAMGKSAQVPLHVWLPDSMEGPTPISALIHAATMVTAGIFMVARMSPLFELSETALSFVLIIGATTAFFMGLIGIVNNDIKRVIAYSTLSQLGYMTVALGVSAYGAGIFHLMTHAFFKALLFLAAGSVIIAMHHEQDMRKMGGLKQVHAHHLLDVPGGCLALIGFPGSSGFFSKDSLIDAVAASHRAGSGYAYFCVLTGVFITALYTFRMFIMTFLGKGRMDHHTEEHLHESPWVVTLPLVLLAIPSALIGWFTVQPMLFGDFFQGAIHVLPANNVLEHLGEEFHGPAAFTWSALVRAAGLDRRLGRAGRVCVLICGDRRWRIRRSARSTGCTASWSNKYGFDWFNEHVIVACARGCWAGGLWRFGDQAVIDDGLVNGSARTVGWLGSVMRYAQSGYLYHYAFAMILGLASLLMWLIWRT